MIPIGTTYQLKRTPWVNYALVVANVLIYVMGYHAANIEAAGKIRDYMLYPGAPQLHQFFTSVFLHGGLMHLVGNMVFLWVFGNAINDRFGHAGYLAFYLAGGVLAGLGYVLLGDNVPVLGASGAIAAVTGAFLVLLPKTRVTVLLIFYFIMPVELSSLLFLGFQVAFELFMSIQSSMSEGGVRIAHWAHSSGYAFGIGVSAVLLAAKILPRDPHDLLSLIRTRHRRRRYKRMVASGYDPFSYVNSGAKSSPSRGVIAGPESEVAETHENVLRRKISQLCEKQDLQGATEAYLKLLEVSPKAVLSRRAQMDVANQLMSDNRYVEAADAYERYLSQYGPYEYGPDIHLMLGIIYGRYLQQRDKAEHYLSLAVEGLHDERKVALASETLRQVRESAET